MGLQLVPRVRAETTDIRDPARGVANTRVAPRMVPSADGSLIAWAETGTGPPRMRAGHWLTNLQHDGSNAIWGPWIARLGQGRRLIRYDARGTGMSDTNCGELSLDSYVSDMRAVADAAGVETFDIFAASQSMAVTCAFAARYPDRVRRIVSYGGWPQGSRQRATYGSTGMTDAMGTMLRLGWAQPDSGYMKSFAALFMPDATPDQVDAFLRMQLASATPEQAVRIRDVLSRFDVTDVLPDVRAPVLVAHAKGDSLHPFSQARLLMRHLPDARLLALDGHNHILTPEEPAFAELMHAVDEFLR